jgi:hypothetical protein
MGDRITAYRKWKEFLMHTFEMASGAMTLTHISNLMKIG